MKPTDDEGKIVFTRLSAETAAWLEQVRVQLRARGISTVIRKILENVQKEGVTVPVEEKQPRKAKRAA